MQPHDRLKRSDDAKMFAAAINASNNPESKVFAICGKWGSGKSFFVNLVEKHLEVTITRIDSWNLGDHHRLGFQLARIIANHAYGLSARSWKSRRKVFEYIQSISSIAMPVIAVNNGTPQIVGATAGVTALAALTLKHLDRENPVILKEEINRKLAMSNDSIWVVIDDIDRLPKEDVQQLFRLVGSCLDFSNINFLLIYDQKYVHDCFSEFGTSRGSEFVEKIVSYSHQLPAIDDNQIMNIFFERMQEIFGNNFKVPDINSNEYESWMEIISSHFSNIRYVERLSYAVKIVANGLTVDDVLQGHYVDLILFQLLKMSHVEIYEWLVDLDRSGDRIIFNESIFVSEFKNEIPQWLVRFNTCIKECELPKQETVRQVIRTLRPDLDLQTGKILRSIKIGNQELRRYRNPAWRDVYRRGSLSEAPLTVDRWEIVKAEVFKGRMDPSYWIEYRNGTERSREVSMAIVNSESESVEFQIKAIEQILHFIIDLKRETCTYKNADLFIDYVGLLHIFIRRLSKIELAKSSVIRDIRKNDRLIYAALIGYDRSFRHHNGVSGIKWRVSRIEPILDKCFGQAEKSGTIFSDGGWMYEAQKLFLWSTGRESERASYMTDNDLFTSYIDNIYVLRSDELSRPLVSYHRVNDEFVQRFVAFTGPLKPASIRLQEEYKRDLEIAKRENHSFEPDANAYNPFD